LRAHRWQQWIIVAIAFLIFAAGAGAQEQSTNFSRQVDELLAEWNRTDAPGAVVAVVRDGKIVFQNAYGMADLERGVALTPQSAFEIGSISKQFTAMCVLLLEHDGKLALDDDIRATIPEMPAYEETITLRHLLHHTSGIRDIETLVPLAGLPWVNYQSPSDQLKLIARQKALNFSPNSRFLYSNSGYFLLALVVERVSGRSLRDFAEERIFEPLGMRNTVFWDDPKQVIANRAIAYSPNPDGGWGMEMWNLPFAGPAGLYTTVGDLALWDANFYDNRLGGDAELIERMETSGVLDDGEATEYAFGLDVRTKWGLPAVRHGGAWMGYRAFMMRFPKQRLTMIFLSNASSIDFRGTSIARLYLADHLDSDDDDVVFEPPETIELSPEELASYEGAYWAESAGLLRTIEVRDGSLHYVRGEDNTTELGAVEPGNFFMLETDFRVDVVFNTGAENPEGTLAARTMTVVIEGDDDLVFNVVTPPSGADLSNLAGNYWSDELQRELHLQVDEDRLLVFWAGDPKPARALPIGTDNFLIRQFIPVPWSPMDVRLRAERNADGQIVRLTLDCRMVSGIVLTRRDS